MKPKRAKIRSELVAHSALHRITGHQQKDIDTQTSIPASTAIIFADFPGACTVTPGRHWQCGSISFDDLHASL